MYSAPVNVCLSVTVDVKHACDRRMDRQTDGQNYDSQDRASIAAFRGKNEFQTLLSPVSGVYCDSA